MDRLWFLDSNLTTFEVSRVEVLGRAGLFGWRPGFQGTYVRVNLELEKGRRLDLDEAKRVILEFASEHPGIYDSGMPREEFEGGVRAAVSARDLLSFLQ